MPEADQVPENKKQSEKQVGKRKLQLVQRPIVINSFGTLRSGPSLVLIAHPIGCFSVY